ncbi:MAG: GNAT family N-acetyltransferase [Candidatus Gastranaerophilales bacterium]|nr:GNAT family N-acetyltransferase [Candidatus Gastranaerophilales bacterium]
MVQSIKTEGSIAFMYEIAVLEEKYFRVFQGAYNDFRLKARTDYKFEIDPLIYDDFIESYQKGLISCIVLLEDSIPTGFLAYTTVPKDVIELFVIHCLGTEDIEQKYKLLFDKFMEQTRGLRKHSTVSYAMLGIQEGFRKYVSQCGFGMIDTGVVVFDIKDKQKLKELAQFNFMNLPIGYKLTPYRDIYFEELANVIFASFKDSTDSNFDPRFASIDGCRDITHKITTSVYGRFLPQASKILLYENKLVGFCLANVTGDGIANLPLIGIIPEHRGLKLSNPLVKASVLDVVKLHQGGIIELNELNASLDLNLQSALKMYESVGFVQLYRYSQAYLPRG